MAAEKANVACYEVLKVLDDEDVETRHGGCVAIVDGKLYFWGGEASIIRKLPEVSDDDLDDDDEDNVQDDDSNNETTTVVTLPQLKKGSGYPFDVFDMETLTWSQKFTSGMNGDSDVPLVGLGSNLTYHKPTNSMYLIGGWNGRSFTSDVYSIELSANDLNWVWERICVPRGSICPCPRYLVGVLLHDDRLCTFGGVCKDHGEDLIDDGADYDPYTSDNVVYDIGWTNQYYEFVIGSRKWQVPMSGNKNRPIPTGAHMFVKIDNHRALCFGGRTRKGRTDNTFIFYLDGRRFDGPLDLHVKPPAKVFTTLCPLVDFQKVGDKLGPGVPPLEQKLVLLWGKNVESDITSDSWVFDCQKNEWKQIELNDEGRYWHMACSYFPEPCESSETHVVVYGGAKLAPGKQVKYIEQRGLTIFSFGVKTLKQLSLMAVVSALLEHSRCKCIYPSEEELLHALKVPTKVGHKIHQTLQAYSHLE